MLKLAANGSEEAVSIISEATDGLYKTADELRDVIFNLDPDMLDRFARALGMTEDTTRKYADALRGLRMEDVLGGVDSLNERYETLSDIFSDIAQDSKITQENLQKVVENYSFLLQGKDGSFSYENILGNLVEVLTGGANSESGLAYGALLVSEAGTNQSYWKSFQDRNKDNWESVFGEGSLSEEDIKRLNAASSMADVQDLIKNNDLATQKWTEHLQGTISQLEVSEILQEKIVKAQVNAFETQISNLESIKDSLGDINEARQKELDLIKAKDALENARKEKKMVYRAGIGWTYESDQTAIQEAQSKIEELETQRTEEDVQLQIDSIQKQLDMLNNMDEEEELRAAIQTMEEWLNIVSSQLGEGEKDSYLYQISTFFSKKFQTQVKDAIIASGVANSGDLYSQDKLEAMEDVKEKREALSAAREALNKETPGTVGYNNKVAEYNAALKNYQNSVSTAKDMHLSEKDLKNNDFSKEEISDYNNAGAMQQEKEQVVTFTNVPKWKNDNWLFGKKGGNAFTDGKTTISSIDDAIYSSAALLSRTSSVGAYGKGNGSQKMYKYNQSSGAWEYIASGDDMKNWVSNFDDETQYPAGTLVAFTTDNLKDPARYVIKSTNGYWYAAKAYASGTTSAHGGLSMVNELGTEGIITPQGTLTSLPSRTGVVPADITKNLWALGEVAPNLVRNLDSITSKFPEGSLGSSDDHSTNINNLYATFQADENFDFDEFLIDVRGVIGTTRHSAG